MKIYIDKIVLADDSLGRAGPQVTAFQGSREFELQVAEFVRAEAVSQFDRDNARTEFQFSTSRLYASNLEAEAGLLTMVRDLPKFGTVTLFAGGTSRFYLEDAAVTITSFSFTGLTTFLSYRITGGVLKKDKTPTLI